MRTTHQRDHFSVSGFVKLLGQLAEARDHHPLPARRAD